MSPARRREAVEQVLRSFPETSVRRVCGVLEQPRSTQQYRPRESEFAERVTERTVELAMEYGRYGYRRVTGLLRNEGWGVNPKRVERIGRREGLKVPRRQPKRVSSDTQSYALRRHLPLRTFPPGFRCPD